MEKWISVVSGLFLLAVAAFAWGWSAGDLGIFPAETIRSVQNRVHDFVKGDVQDQDLTLTEKLANDLGGRPHRLLVSELYNKKFNGCRHMKTHFQLEPESCALISKPEKETFEPGYLAFGPYVYLSEGRYRAEIVYSASYPSDQAVGKFDVVSNLGHTRILSPETAFGTEGNLNREVFQFDLAHPQSHVEVRFFLEKPASAKIKHIKLSRISYEAPSRRVVLDIPDLRERRDDPYILTNYQNEWGDGYFIVFGSIDMKESVHGIFIINEVGEIIHTIPIKDDAVRDTINDGDVSYPDKIGYITPETRFPHGLEVMPDGSVIINDGDPGNTIRRIDWCGQEVWTKHARSHHAVNVTGDIVWHLGINDRFVQRNAKTGEVIREISWDNVLSANPKLGVLKIRHDVFKGKVLSLPYHFNDIDPLLSALSDKFPMFESGDLLVSARSLDLVFVLDPETLKVKWWRVGPWRRQHDPDWQRNGKITVYDNQVVDEMSSGASRIVQIDPATMATDVIYDGAQHDVYSKITGTHQVLEDGSLIMTSPQQGRAVWVDPDGSLRFDLRNAYDDRANLLLSEVRYIPPDFFTFDPAKRRCETGGTSASAE